MTDYGKKGGTSATAGKKMTAYLVTFPDGTTAIKKSSRCSAPEALAAIYQHEGKWHASGIYDDKPDWAIGTAKAVRINT